MGPQQHESISLASFNAVYTLFSSGGRRFYHSSNFRAVPRCFLASRMRIHHSSSSPAVPELCFRYMIPCCFRAVPGKMNACAAQQPVVLHGGNLMSSYCNLLCAPLTGMGTCVDHFGPMHSAAKECRHNACIQQPGVKFMTRLRTIVSTAFSSSSASSSDANTDDDADSSRPAKRNRPPSVDAAGGGSAGGKGPAVVQASAAAGATAACVPGSPAKRVCI